MIYIDRAVVEQALEALIAATPVKAKDPQMQADAIVALRAALAEPVQEPPIGWLYPEGLAALKAGKCWTVYGTKQDDNNIPIYDAVAPRAEPRASESGAGFESLPASLEPVQEPVAWIHGDEFGDACHWVGGSMPPAGTKLYTAPPQRKPLTDEQVYNLWREFMLYQDGLTPSGLQRVARAIERAHGIKENT